jgi:prephenate dehydratase
MTTIHIQGEEGSFHHEAARILFGTNVTIVPQPTFRKVFEGVSDTEHGLVAIENSLYGGINEVYDLLESHGFSIFAETELHIHQNLNTLPGAIPENIKEIHSHPVALAQCVDYLEEAFPHAEKIEVEDTAGAVREIVERGDPTIAAIAGITAAELYGATVLARSIEDNPINFTRFIGITKHPKRALTELATPTTPHKASIVLTTPHVPGALYEALGVFVSYQANLTKLHSRPLVGEKWQYRFYIDLETTPDELNDIVRDLEENGNTITILGTYATHPM